MSNTEQKLQIRTFSIQRIGESREYGRGHAISLFLDSFDYRATLNAADGKVMV
jgi:hypothetical protein